MSERLLLVGAFSLLGIGENTLAPGCAMVCVDAADPIIIPSGFLRAVFDAVECSAKLL